MESIKKKNDVKIMLGILIGVMLIFMMMQCGTNSRISRLEKQQKVENVKIDSNFSANKLDFQKALKIEGLKAEKRMIQATDRKILDVNRENAIDEELKKLEAHSK